MRYQKTSADTILSWLLSTVGWWATGKGLEIRGRRLQKQWKYTPTKFRSPKK